MPIKDVHARPGWLDEQGDWRSRAAALAPAVIRFFLTTAIDYVNSRPHLGTAYEKITADAIARYHRLTGVRHAFPDGQRRALAERLRSARRSRARIRSRTATRWSRRSARRLAAARHVVRRLHPHHRHAAGTSRPCRRWRRPVSTTAISTKGTYEGYYCVGCEAFKPEKDLVDGQCPIHKTKPEWIKEKNCSSGSPSTSSRCSTHYAGAPAFIEPEIRRNEILRLVEGGLEDISVSRAGQSWGIPAAVRSRERGLRLVRRADQLRHRRRLRLGRGTLPGVVARRPARHRQGHHALPLRDLAGHADERGVCRCRARSSATAGCTSRASG